MKGMPGVLLESLLVHLVVFHHYTSNPRQLGLILVLEKEDRSPPLLKLSCEMHRGKVVPFSL